MRDLLRGVIPAQSLLVGVVTAFLVGLAVTVVANIGTTVYLHRAMAHKALSLRAPASFAFRFVLWISTGIRPRQWVAVHRKHHAFTDVEGDPHSPVLLGWKTVQMKNVALYRSCATEPETVQRYAKDMPADRWDTLFFDRTILGLTIGIGLHNNHHAAPTSARLSHRWFEIDYGWWVIKALAAVRLARVRLTEIKLVGQSEPIAA